MNVSRKLILITEKGDGWQGEYRDAFLGFLYFIDVGPRRVIDSQMGYLMLVKPRK